MNDKNKWFVHYGNEYYDASEFKIARNSNHVPFNKPVGGLWGCEVETKFDWKTWCNHNDFGNDKYMSGRCFYFRILCSLNTYTISSKADYDRLPKRIVKILGDSYEAIDFEKLMIDGIGDGISIKALIVSFDDKDELNDCLPGYDCNCVIVLDDGMIAENRTYRNSENIITLNDLLPIRWQKTILGNMEFSFLVNSPDERDYFYVEQPDERIGFKVLVGTYDGDVIENTGFSLDEIKNIFEVVLEVQR